MLDAMQIKGFKKNIFVLFLIASLLFFIIPYFAPVQAATSNCAVVEVGSPNSPRPVCKNQVSQTGIIYPPSLVENKIHPGYYQMPPDSPNGPYDIYTCSGRTWGSKELIGVLYTVANRWKQRYPQGRINIGDLNATGHKTHFWGRAVDIDATTNGKDWVADFTRRNYNQQATIELGKMFADTNLILSILYNDVTVNNAVLDYSKQTGLSKGMDMRWVVNHNNHFHVNIRIDKLETWGPDCGI